MTYPRTELMIALWCTQSRWEWAISDTKNGAAMDCGGMPLRFGHSNHYRTASDDAWEAFDGLVTP